MKKAPGTKKLEKALRTLGAKIRKPVVLFMGGLTLLSFLNISVVDLYRCLADYSQRKIIAERVKKADEVLGNLYEARDKFLPLGERMAKVMTARLWEYETLNALERADPDLQQRFKSEFSELSLPEGMSITGNAAQREQRLSNFTAEMERRIKIQKKILLGLL